MKKLIVSLLVLAAATGGANAASKGKMKANGGIRIDHSKDIAYSSKWAATAQSPAPGTHFMLTDSDEPVSYMKGKTWYYGLHNFTLHGLTAASMDAPYQGKDAPSWDGPIRNNYRNIRAYNESEPLPSNAGSRR